MKKHIIISIISVDNNEKKNNYSFYLRILSVLSYNKPDSIKLRSLTIKELKYKDICETDVFIFYREIFLYNFFYPFLKQIKNKKIIIYDIDDYLLSVPSYSFSYTFFNNINKSGFIKNIKLADLVITSTEYLEKEMQKMSNNVIVIPNTLNVLEEEKISCNDNKVIKILLCSSDNLKIQTFRKDFIKVLQSVKEKYKNKIELNMLGFIELQCASNIFDRVFSIMAYNNYFNFIEKNNFDIGLVPLGGAEDPDSVLMHSCKSNIKFLEFAKYGISGIYSNVPAYYCVKDHEDGILVDNNYESWFKAICELIDNNSLREKIINNSYQKLKNNYNLKISSDLLYKNICKLKDEVIKKNKLNIIIFIFCKIWYIVGNVKKRYVSTLKEIYHSKKIVLE
jgi:hypothetical protein